MLRMPAMTHQPANRPRIAATYASGTVRARRWHGDGDVRGYRPPRGWTARADLTDLHPSRAAPCRAPCGGSSKPRITSRTGPKPCRLGAGGRKLRARRWPRPVHCSKPKRPIAAFGQAAMGRSCAKSTKPASVAAHRAANDRPSPAAMGGAGVATPRLAAAGCTKACRPRRWRFVVCTSRKTVHRHAAQPRFYGASTPRLSMWP